MSWPRRVSACQTQLSEALVPKEKFRLLTLAIMKRLAVSAVTGHFDTRVESGITLRFLQTFVVYQIEWLGASV